MQKALRNTSSRVRAGKSLSLILTIAAIAVTSACGGKTDFTPSSTTNPAPGVTLQSIQVIPTSSIILLAESRQLFANAIYSDGTIQDISPQVTWSAPAGSTGSNSSTVVTVSSSGVATGMALGATSITATLGSVTGVLTLTVATNGFSSSTLAVLSVPKGNSQIDVGYLPEQTKINGGYAVQEVNLDADQFTSFLPVPVALMTSIGMPAGFVPNAAAASHSSALVAVISYTSPDVQVIDASNNPLDVASNTIIATYHSPVSQSVTLNGTFCMICAAVVNPSTNQLILSTAQGFYLMNLSSGVFTKLPFTPSPAPSANITVNPVATPDPFILSTVPSAGEIQVLDLTTNSVTTFGNVGVAPTAGAIDLNTQFSAVVDGSTGDQTLIDFTNPQTPVISTVQGVGVCPGGPAYMNMASLGVGASPIVSNATHFLMAGQTGGNCVGVAAWPIGGSGAGNSLQAPNIFYGYGPMPATPDGNVFLNDTDPNAIATFTSVFNKTLYGVVIGQKQQWLAKINLGTVASLGNLVFQGPTLPSGANIGNVLLTGLASDPIFFLPTPSTQLTLSATNLGFGTVSVGTPSPQLTVTVTNISNSVSQVAVSPQVTLQGSNPGDFGMISSCVVALQPQTNCFVSLIFTPTATGTRSATLSVAASGQPTQTVQLSGTGQ